MNRILVLAATFLSLAALDAAAINKCVDKNGKVSYQEGACPEDGKSEVIRTPPPAPSPDEADAAPARKSAPKSEAGDPEDPHMQMLVSTLATYELCAVEPSFNAKYGATFANWKSRNAALFDRLGRSPRYQTALEAAREQTKTQASKSIDKFVAFCDTTFAPAVQKNYGK